MKDSKDSPKTNRRLRERFADLSIESGVLCCDFDVMHKRMEEVLGRPVFMHEMADGEVWLSMKIALAMPGYREVVREDPLTSARRMFGKDKVIAL